MGDIHIENFGTWRDYEGRLVWGVNDFDEAAEMPYALDLVRLTTSAILAREEKIELDDPWQHILAGYRRGLKKPKPLVLDKKEDPLHGRFEVKKGKRDEFWDEEFAPEKNKVKGAMPPASYVRALEASRPDPSAELIFWPRTAGGGSLGRPRWVGYGIWRNSPFVREAKAIVPSGWTLVGGRGPQRLRCQEIARGDHRCPDPWYAMSELDPDPPPFPQQPQTRIQGQRPIGTGG